MLFENSKRSGRSSLSEEVISMNKSEQCPLTMSPTNRTRSRTAVEQRRSVIVAVLHQHQNGLTTREIREAIGLSRSLTDSALSGLFTRGVVHKRGNRYCLRPKMIPENTNKIAVLWNCVYMTPRRYRRIRLSMSGGFLPLQRHF
jgi:hypothetical protein